LPKAQVEKRGGFGDEFEKELAVVDGLLESEATMELVRKEEVTFVIYLDSDDPKARRVVTTSIDGFIKMNEVDLVKNTYTCRKSFLVC